MQGMLMVSAADMTHLYCERTYPFNNENSSNNMMEPEAPLDEVTMPPVPVVSFDVPDILLAVVQSDDQYEARTFIDDGQKENDYELMDEPKQKTKMYMQIKMWYALSIYVSEGRYDSFYCLALYNLVLGLTEILLKTKLFKWWMSYMTLYGHATIIKG